MTYQTREKLTYLLLKAIKYLNRTKDRDLSYELHMLATSYNTRPGEPWYPPEEFLPTQE